MCGIVLIGFCVAHAIETFPAKISEEANLWQAPDIRTGPILKLPKDTPVSVLAKREGWYRVLYKTRTFGVDGWVFGTCVELEQENPEKSIPGIKVYDLVTDEETATKAKEKTASDKNRNMSQPPESSVPVKKRQYEKPADLNAGLKELDLSQESDSASGEGDTRISDISGLGAQYLAEQNIEDFVAEEKGAALVSSDLAVDPTDNADVNNSSIASDYLVSKSLLEGDIESEKNNPPMNPRHIESLDERIIGFSVPGDKKNSLDETPKPIPVFSEGETGVSLRRIDEETRLAKSRPSPIRSAGEIPVPLTASTSPIQSEINISTGKESETMAKEVDPSDDTVSNSAQIGQSRIQSNETDQKDVSKIKSDENMDITLDGSAKDERMPAETEVPAQKGENTEAGNADFFQIWLRTGLRLMSVVFSCLALLLSFSALRRAGK
jgi:hypothetical protein